MELQRRKVQVDGLVQGVGFRPFVYNLASRFSITGWIANTSEGVQMELQGKQAALTSFLDALQTQKPPLARPQIVQIKNIPTAKNEKLFSRLSKVIRLLVPDSSIKSSPVWANDVSAGRVEKSTPIEIKSASDSIFEIRFS